VAFRLFRPGCLLLAAALCILLFLARSLWLAALGYALIHDDGPAKADIAVVPAGEYGLHETDLAIPFAVRQGFPAEWFVAFPNEALSTKEEALVILQELRRRNVKSFLLVTSDYHSARAGRIYRSTERATGGGPGFRVVTVSDEFFHPDSWWRTRQGQKTAFFEWSKTFATIVGL
jgi:hypothetical protein